MNKFLGNTQWRKIFFVILSFYCLAGQAKARANTNFVVSKGNKLVSLVYDSREPRLIEIAVNALADDIQRITGSRPMVTTKMKNVSGNVIIVGTRDQSRFFQKGILPEEQQPLGWETYSYSYLDEYSENISQAMLICGSDKRGAAFGVFDLSEKLGVSPWYWWADIVPELRQELTVGAVNFKSKSPSVKYRGIFLNDEDWGLQPWAAKTYEPEEGDIGPKTYARIFELLLRLKANLIWPAMHSCTSAFYKNPDNPIVANDYGIVVGTSHAEPMLRNNVNEWDHKTMGDYNFFTNKEGVLNYWKQRVKESVGKESVYTVGMRGIHDSGMAGAGSMSEKVFALDEIIGSQRKLLEKYVNKSEGDVPQAFTVYKEVLDIYDEEMKLPENITIVWPDDNYGFIRRLSDEEEQQRSGGSGIYYHISYWGRPHDYLWLNSTHPSLIREEMLKAAHQGSRRLWVVNVGDIKPAEFETSMFLNMAYDIDRFQAPLSEKEYMIEWYQDIFGEKKGKELADVLWKYYDLNFERRPEFMGWSQTEPTRKTNFTAYNHFEAGDEAQQRLDAFAEISRQVRNIREQMSPRTDDVYFQLVYYPVLCAGYQNEKFLYQDKAFKYAMQKRASANDYALMAKAAYDSIVAETEYYNKQLSNGKWHNMMNYAPRNLPVFEEPVSGHWNLPEGKSWAIATEGDEFIRQFGGIYGPLSLPAFYSDQQQQYFVDIFLQSSKSLAWSAVPSADWIVLNIRNGNLTGKLGGKQQRIQVSVDWSKAPETNRLKGKVTFKGEDGKELSVGVNAYRRMFEPHDDTPLFVENNGYISIYAEHFSRCANGAGAKWEVLEGLGYTGSSVWANPLENRPVETNAEKSSTLEYDFMVDRAREATIHIYCIPVHPVTSNYGVQIAVGLNDEEPIVLSHQTYGRSEAWKQNVLSNNAEMVLKFKVKSHDRNVLKIQAVDPGVIIDRIEIDTGRLPSHYSELPETKI